MKEHSHPVRAIVSVINDLSTDQRVDRTCNVLVEMGFEVTLIGRKLSSSQPLDTRNYAMHRFSLLINSGPLFYLVFNIRLFWFLLFHKAELLYANDLDTLMATGCISRLRSIPLIYDSHELFTEVPELKGKPIKKKIWSFIENRFAPGADSVITVNSSIAGILQQRFEREVGVVRNLPLKYRQSTAPGRVELSLPLDKKILILQGSGINVDRGAEESVMMMQYLEGFMLIVAGGGDIISDLKRMVRQKGLEEKVLFIPRQPYDDLMRYTAVADAGLTLDKDTNLNYRYSLPNKLFDYIQAGIPVIASDLIELRKIIETYGVGLILKSHDPAAMAAQIGAAFADEDLIEGFRKASQTASKVLCWENEKGKLIQAIESCIDMNTLNYR